MKSIFFILLFSLTTATFGRAPAVEPIRGISIKEYKEVDPASDPGFDWRQDSLTVQNTGLITTREPAQKDLITNTTSQKKSWPTYAFLLSLLTLPFVLWYSVMKGLEGHEMAEHESTGENYPHHDNTVDLLSERNKREEQAKKDHISKAS